MMRTSVACAIASWSLSVAAVAHAEEYYVDHSAAAGGSGTEAAPFQTINDVRAVLRTGDTVWIRDGVYQETVDFWHVPEGSGGRTSIRAAPGHNPVIDGGGTSSFIFQAGETHRMTFEGLTFRNAEGSAIHFYYAHDGEVLRCTTESSVGRAVELYHSSRGYVFQSDLHGGVSGKGSEGAVIEANRIHHSRAEGITLHDNAHGCMFLSNIVHGNHSVNIYVDSAWDMVVDGNLVFTTGAPEAELAGIQLADGSPAIDRGADVAGLDVDFNGALRPFGSGFDIGAFEWGATRAAAAGRLERATASTAPSPCA